MMPLTAAALAWERGVNIARFPAHALLASARTLGDGSGAVGAPLGSPSHAASVEQSPIPIRTELWVMCMRPSYGWPRNLVRWGGGGWVSIMGSRPGSRQRLPDIGRSAAAYQATANVGGPSQRR